MVVIRASQICQLIQRNQSLISRARIIRPHRSEGLPLFPVGVPTSAESGRLSGLFAAGARAASFSQSALVERAGRDPDEVGIGVLVAAQGAQRANTRRDAFLDERTARKFSLVFAQHPECVRKASRMESSLGARQDCNLFRQARRGATLRRRSWFRRRG